MQISIYKMNDKVDSLVNSKDCTKESNPGMNFLLIDTSYLIFYRYFAIIQWWKHAKSDIELPKNPYDCEEFVEKFTKIFLASIETIKKKLKINKQECKVIAARDCPRKEIWRNTLYPKYKEHRYKDDDFMGGDFFKHVYGNNFLIRSGVNEILKFPNLEGDDLIAITKNYIREKYPQSKIYIIANDYDYLQLLDDYTWIINLKFKDLRESKKVFPEPEKNLFYKIVLGDKSDNIPPVFTKCGPKTAEKYYENRDELDKALSVGDALERFERNKKLVSFSEIPAELVKEFMEQYKQVFVNI